MSWIQALYSRGTDSLYFFDNSIGTACLECSAKREDAIRREAVASEVLAKLAGSFRGVPFFIHCYTSGKEHLQQVELSVCIYGMVADVKDGSEYTLAMLQITMFPGKLPLLQSTTT